MGGGLLDGFAVSSDEEIPEFNDFSASTLSVDVCEITFDVLAVKPSLVSVPLFSVQMLERDPDAPSSSASAPFGPALRMHSLEVVGTYDKASGKGGCAIVACASSQGTSFSHLRSRRGSWVGICNEHVDA